MKDERYSLGSLNRAIDPISCLLSTGSSESLFIIQHRCQQFHQIQLNREMDAAIASTNA